MGLATDFLREKLSVNPHINEPFLAPLYNKIKFRPKKWRLYAPKYIPPNLIFNIECFISQNWYMGLTSWSNDITGPMVRHCFSWTYGMWAYCNPISVVATKTGWRNGLYEWLLILRWEMTWRNSRGKETDMDFYVSNQKSIFPVRLPDFSSIMSPFSSISNANGQWPMLHCDSAIAHSLNFCNSSTGEWHVKCTINVAQGGVYDWLMLLFCTFTCFVRLHVGWHLSRLVFLASVLTIHIRLGQPRLWIPHNSYWASLWHAPLRAPRSNRRTIWWSRIYYLLPNPLVSVELLPTISNSLKFGYHHVLDLGFIVAIFFRTHNFWWIYFLGYIRPQSLFLCPHMFGTGPNQ